MKRIIGFFLVLTFPACATFAGGQVEQNGGAASDKNVITSMGVGYNNTTHTLGYTSDYEDTHDTGDLEETLEIPAFVFNLTTYSGKNTEGFSIGFLSDLNILITSTPTYSWDDGTSSDDYDLDTYGYESGFGMETILGPGIYMPFSPEFSLQLGLGMHFGFSVMTSDETDSSGYEYDTVSSFGLGVGNITRLNWQFSDKLGIMFGLDMAYDFVSMVNDLPDDDSVYGPGTSFSITPLIMVSISTAGVGERVAAVTSGSGKSGSSGSGSSSSSQSSIARGEEDSRTRKPSSSKNNDGEKEWDSDPYD